MSENNKKNQPMQNSAVGGLRDKLRRTAESDGVAPSSAGPDTTQSGDVDIEELLRKYLPSYADAPAEAPAKPAAPQKEPEVSPKVPEETVFEEEAEELPRETKKKRGLFSRHRAEEEEPEAPDAALFQQIAEENGAEDSDSDMRAYFPVSDGAEEAAEAEDAVRPQAEAEAEEETASAEEIDETDRNLMVAFGLEEQLDRRAGVGTADKVAAQNDAHVREREEEQRRAAEFEYTERAQTPRIAEAYKYTLTSLKIKLIAGALLTLLLFLFENISIFGVQFAGALDPAVYPVVYTMISLQLMLLVAAVGYEQVLSGARNLITGRPTPESVTAVLTVFGVLYSAYIAMTAEQGVEPVMYNFAVAMCILFSILFAWLNTMREIDSFNIVSSKKPKYVFRRIPATEESPESKAFGAMDEDNPDVLQIERTAFVDGYFSRTTAVLHSTRVYVSAMLSIVCAAAVLLAILSAIGGSGARDAVTIAYVSVLAAIPMSMFFTYSYPFYKANREAYEIDSTIVGESSLDEYSGASIISFDDKNVFPSYGVKVQNVKIYNNNRIDRVLYYAASAFARAGGPLCDVFEVATLEMGHSDEVEIVSADTGYLETRVDGRNILFGRSATLTEMGYEIPEEIVEEDSYIEGDLSILYMFREGDLIAKMYIKYVMDADFEFILRQFTQNGTCVCVKTLDPNIDADMIFAKVKGKNYPLRVIKHHDGDAACERSDSGIVTRGTTKSLLQVVSLCDMVLSVKRTNTVVSVAAAIVTLAIMFIVSLSGSVGVIASWLIVVNQLFWMLPAWLTTKMYIK